MFFPFSFAKRGVLGVHFHPDGLHLLQFRSLQSSCSIQAYLHFQVEFYNPSSAEQLRLLLAKSNFKGRSAAFALPDSMIKMQQYPIENDYLDWELEKLLRVKLRGAQATEVYCDFQKQGLSQLLQLWQAEPEPLEARLRFLSQAELSVVHIDIESYCLAFARQKLNSCKSVEQQLLLAKEQEPVLLAAALSMRGARA